MKALIVEKDFQIHLNGDSDGPIHPQTRSTSHNALGILGQQTCTNHTRTVRFPAEILPTLPCRKTPPHELVFRLNPLNELFAAITRNFDRFNSRVRDCHALIWFAARHNNGKQCAKTVTEFWREPSGGTSPKGLSEWRQVCLKLLGPEGAGSSVSVLTARMLPRVRHVGSATTGCCPIFSV